MRILTASAFFETHGGGVEIVAGALARALARRGHQSYLTGAAFDPSPPDDLINPVALKSRDPIEKYLGLPMPVPTSAARKRLIQEIAAADGVIIHDSLYVSSMLAARTAHRLGKPWVVVQHIGEIPYSNPILRAALGTANRLVTRPVLAHASQVFFISDVVRRHFSGIHYRRKPRLMFNGVDSAQFRLPSEAERASARARLGLSLAARPQLLFVGRFVEKKGLAALRHYAALNPDCDLLMVGDGPINPSAWNAANVTILGRQTRAELAQLYHACDALVLPSIGEGYPLVVQEALASGLPVYCGMDSATADPGARPYLNAITVDPRNPATTAERLAGAIASRPPFRNSAAADYAARVYDWDANAHEIEQSLLA